jgi:hypothetical protein
MSERYDDLVSGVTEENCVAIGGRASHCRAADRPAGATDIFYDNGAEGRSHLFGPWPCNDIV